MKRILFIAISSLLLAVGCQRESVGPGQSGKVITASFSVSLPGDMATKAISDGTGATELLFLAYDADGRHLDMDQKVTVEGKKASLSVKLVAGTGYKFVFWAQKPGQYAITEADNGHPVVSIASTALPYMMNDDAYDAFYAFKEVDPQDANFSMDISLTRPFAQLNVAVSEADYAAAAAGYDLASLFQTQFSVKGVPGAIDLFTGEVSGATDITYYKPASVPADEITSGQENYRRIAMVYVLAPAEQSSIHDVTLAVIVGDKGNSGRLEKHKDIPNVPLKRNYCTNIIGNVFSVGGTFSVQVDRDFGTPDTDIDLNPTPYGYYIGTFTFQSKSSEGETVAQTWTVTEKVKDVSYSIYGIPGPIDPEPAVEALYDSENKAFVLKEQSVPGTANDATYGVVTDFILSASFTVGSMSYWGWPNNSNTPDVILTMTKEGDTYAVAAGCYGGYSSYKYSFGYQGSLHGEYEGLARNYATYAVPASMTKALP